MSAPFSLQHSVGAPRELIFAAVRPRCVGEADDDAADALVAHAVHRE